MLAEAPATKSTTPRPNEAQVPPETTSLASPPLGRLLIDAGALSTQQLEEVLAIQKSDKRRLGELLVERGIVTALELAQILSRQLSCPWISLAQIEIAADVIALLPADVAMERHAVPVHLRLSKGQRILYVATDDPTDDVSLAYCAAAADMPVRAMLAETNELKAALTRFYAAPEGTPAPAPIASAAPAKPSAAPKSGVKPPLPEAAKSEPRLDSPRDRESSPPPRNSNTEPAPPPTMAIAQKPLPPPPPLPKRPMSSRAMRVATGAAVDLEDTDLEEVLEPPPSREKRAPMVLALNAPPAFLAECQGAATTLGARVVDGTIHEAGELVLEHRPCAIVVTDDVYAFDRTGLNRLALEHDAHLVVWSENVDGRQLQPLLAGAIDRWGRSSYEKGAIVDGRYEMMRDLGEASYGSLWEVRNVRTARRSVLALALRASEDEEVIASIRRTHRALARITHPGAPELRDAGITELGDPYIVIEPLEGRTLDGLVAARGRLEPAEACRVALQLAEVLASAHGMGVLHNDVVAEKVLIARDGYGVERVRLVGWNKASVNDRAALNARGDITAVVMCMFESLLGRRPKPDETMKSSGLPEPIAALIARALGWTEGETVETMRDLVDALRAVEPTARDRTNLLASKAANRASYASLPPAAVAPAKTDDDASASGERRHPRGAYRTPVRIEIPGRGSVDGKSEDISIGGLLIVARGTIDPDTDVTIRFALPLDGKVVAEAAKVRWSRNTRTTASSGASAFGVELAGPSDETIRQVERYVSLMGEASDEG
ncbi:MAG: PilZ domain-containing protein [Deltaproteobacteria bacterium]|nr:PilZ domain-containing protein [Deltaproteobacteria bacterium]